MRSTTIVTPQSFSLSPTPGTTISVDSIGSIRVTGAPGSSIVLQTYPEGTPNSNLNKTVKEQGLRSLVHDWTATHLIFVTGGAERSMTASIVPLIVTPPSLAQAPRIRVQILANLTPPGTTDLSLFCQSTQKSMFLSVPDGQTSEGAVTFSTGAECGQFSITPVRTLIATEGMLKMSILTPHTVIAESGSLNRLPTPPPSPLIRPFSRRLSEISPVEAASEPEDEEEPTAKEAPSLALSTPAPAGVRRYLGAVFSLLVMFGKLWLLRVIIFFSARRVSNGSFKQINDSRPAEVQEDGDDAEEEVDEGTVVSDSSVPQLEEDVFSTSTAADAGILAELEGANLKGSQHASLLYDIPAGNVSVLVQSDVSVESIQFELDGKPVKRIVRDLDDSTSFVQFISGPVGGRLSVRVL